MPSVLVTGASRGIGRATALRLVSSGWHVFAGVRRPEDGEALRAAAAQGAVEPVLLDVTEGATVAALPEVVGPGLDAVVNNAGIVVSGPLEALALDELRRQLEVNVTGQLAVTQAVLPALRASRRGRIVFISSVSGRVATPLLGAYGASKFALEGLADALRVELRPWKIAVSLVEPGSMDTDLWRTAPQQADEVMERMSPGHRRLYERQLQAVRKLSLRVQKRTGPPEDVAAAVERALSTRRPRARYLVGADARAQVSLRAALPARAWDGMLALVSGSR